MQFPDSTLLAFDVAVYEPLRWGRMLTTAAVLTVAAASAAMLVDAESLQHAIDHAAMHVHRTAPTGDAAR